MTSLQEQRDRIERIRIEQGDEAANRASCGQMGAAIGSLGGAAKGAFVGLLIFPGKGTAIGEVAGF